jgi:Mrp family chromosome partitioning ATPase
MMAERQPTESAPEPDEEAVHDDGPPDHRVLWDEELLSGASVSVPPPKGARDEPRSTALAYVQPLARSVTSTVGALVVPHLLRVRCRTDPRAVMLGEPDSARAAAFRLLCEKLLEKGLPNVLVVSSAARHDGKTTCALNLALALAERPGTVLLVDGSLAAPALADMFGIDEHTPTSPVLDFTWLAPFKLAELTPRLHVAVPVPHNDEPSVRSETHRLDVLIDRLSRVGYDRLVIDGPTLDESPAAARLIGAADGVLLAVRSGRTTSSALRRAVERMTRGKVLGAVLMDADPGAR